MYTIANFLGVNMYERSRTDRHTGKTYLKYEVQTGSFGSNQILINYLSRFPLFSVKYISYLRWLEIHYMQARREHLTQHGLERARVLKNDFNTTLKSTSINWDHIKNFYI